MVVGSEADGAYLFNGVRILGTSHLQLSGQVKVSTEPWRRSARQPKTGAVPPDLIWKFGSVEESRLRIALSA